MSDKINLKEIKTKLINLGNIGTAELSMDWRGWRIVNDLINAHFQ